MSSLVNKSVSSAKKLTKDQLDLLSAMSQAPLSKPFPDVGDFHSTNAIAFYGMDKLKGIYNSDPKAFKEIYRSNAKGVGLALLYGGSYKVIQNGIGVSEGEARSMHSAFFNNLSGFKKHVSELERIARKELKVKNLYGSVIYLDDINHKDFKIANAVKNKLYNYPIQSVAADLVKVIMVKLHDYICKYRLSQWEGDAINKTYYRHIIGLDLTEYLKLKKSLTDNEKLDNKEFQDLVSKKKELEKEAEGLALGDTLIVCYKRTTEDSILKDSEGNNISIIAKWPTPLSIDSDFIIKHNLTTLF